MNKKRETKVRKVVKMAQDAYNLLCGLCEDEQMAYDNTPENLQCSERYDRSGECIDSMEDALGSLDDAISILEAI